MQQNVQGETSIFSNRSKLRRFADVFLKILYPERISCIHCGIDLDMEDRYRYDLCSRCMDDMHWIQGPTCKYCGGPIPPDNETEYCYSCAVSGSNIIGCVACFEYYGTGKQLIMDYKYSKNTYLGRYFAAMLYDNIVSAGEFAPEVIVPVPLHASRLRSRGFNQMEIIGSALGEMLQVECLADAIHRNKKTPRLKRLGREMRRAVLEDAFGVEAPKVRGKHVLLIDDIFTTGATMNLCAQALYEAGAARVYGAVLAVNIKD